LGITTLRPNMSVTVIVCAPLPLASAPDPEHPVKHMTAATMAAVTAHARRIRCGKVFDAPHDAGCLWLGGEATDSGLRRGMTSVANSSSDLSSNSAGR
jgi:hypothetical protein